VTFGVVCSRELAYLDSSDLGKYVKLYFTKSELGEVERRAFYKFFKLHLGLYLLQLHLVGKVLIKG
jgi:hypothetical protein